MSNGAICSGKCSFRKKTPPKACRKRKPARRRIAEFNSQTQVHAHVADLVPANIHAILADAQLVLDATDNFETRYLLNDYAVEQNKPWIYAGAVGSYAVTMNILPGVTACLACIFPEPPSGMVETCDTSGILNPAVNLAASLEASRRSSGSSAPAIACDALFFPATCGPTKSLKSTPRTRVPAVPSAATHQFPHLSGVGRPQITLCGRNSVQIHEHNRPVDFAELTRKLEAHGTVRCE